jgi:hypothetical protein
MWRRHPRPSVCLRPSISDQTVSWIPIKSGTRLMYKKLSNAGMSNMRPAGRMRPFASTPAARTKDTVIWSFNDQNCSFYNLNWINVRRSQKNGMLFFIQDVFYTWKYDRGRLFPSVKNILNKENIFCQACQTCGPLQAHLRPAQRIL